MAKASVSGTENREFESLHPDKIQVVLKPTWYSEHSVDTWIINVGSNRNPSFCYFRTLTQRSECLAHNKKVIGSNPMRPTNSNAIISNEDATNSRSIKESSFKLLC